MKEQSKEELEARKLIELFREAGGDFVFLGQRQWEYDLPWELDDGLLRRMEALDHLAVEQFFRRARLTPYQREAVEARFGLVEKRIGELAEERGISNQAASNIAKRALGYLRDRNTTAQRATGRMAS